MCKKIKNKIDNLSKKLEIVKNEIKYYLVDLS